MDCERYKLIITAFLDNELNKEEKADFLAHIDKCPGCKSELEQMQALLNDLQELSKVELPEGYHDELMEKLHRQEQQVQLFMEKTPSTPAKRIMQVHPKKVVKIPFFRRLAGAFAYTFAALMVVSTVGLMLFGKSSAVNDEFILGGKQSPPGNEQVATEYGRSVQMYNMEVESPKQTGNGNEGIVSITSAGQPPESLTSDSQQAPMQYQYNADEATTGNIYDNNSTEPAKIYVNSGDTIKKTAEYKLSTGNYASFVTGIEAMFTDLNLTPNITEQSYIDNAKTFYVSVEIPTGEYDVLKRSIEAFVDNNKEVLLSVEEYSNDESYSSALISRINLKQDEEQRIKVMLTENAGNVADTLALEDRLSQINSEIIDLQGQMALQDNNVSNVRIYVTENPAVMDMPSQISMAFNESAAGTINFFKEFILFWVRISIPLLLAVVIFTPIFLYRHYYKIKNKTS